MPTKQRQFPSTLQSQKILQFCISQLDFYSGAIDSKVSFEVIENKLSQDISDKIFRGESRKKTTCLMMGNYHVRFGKQVTTPDFTFIY